MFADKISEQASNELVAARVTKLAKEAGVFLYGTLSDIVDHVTEFPASLNMMLQVYANTAQISSTYSQGAQDTMRELSWGNSEEAGRFDPLLENFATGEKLPTEDYSTPQFQEGEVKTHVDHVLDMVHDGDNNGESQVRYAVAFVNSTLNPRERKWDEARFVGAAIMLRACAKFMVTGTSLSSDWMQNLEAFLCVKKC
ncbi:uncharacterized protein RAG0_13339 [Rhynchosporium agropyri]|uniref:Uncharacterized protein n=1 Tax=Rhynchosporium agropyri TaxID=914238 RepID=A0A1E1LCD8_9HELO|nr:uncharacterized protein RAG0_13339 [Rhynchosporium agropyri]